MVATKKLALFALSLLGSLGGAEALCRHSEGTVIFPWDQPGRGFATQPHTRGSNAWGFHEREIPPEEDPTVWRIAVLGDSLTWGTGTAEQTWTRAMEERLNTAHGQRSQVLNFGHYGYDAEACAATLRHQASAWRPDLVIYASYTNDVLRNTIIELGRARYPVWIGSSGALLPAPLRRASALARAVEGALLAPRVTETPDLEHYQAQVRSMATQARALGADFEVFGLVPHALTPEGCQADEAFCAKHRAWFEAQRQAVAALDLPFVSGEHALSDRDAAGGFVRTGAFYTADLQDHDHPNPDGQRRMGEYFADQLMASRSAASGR